jgi:HEPN domain-containing protein
MRRPQDWLRQAELDLAAARDSQSAGHHEWACFAAQQAADKAGKALHESVGTEAWGHSVVPGDVMDSGQALDKHYIPARYPSTHPAGAPGDLYTAAEAERAAVDPKRVIEYVRRRLP